MPLALVATGIRQPAVISYEDRPPGPGEVFVRSTLSTEKHGTHLPFYRGDSPMSARTFDSEHGLFMPAVSPPSPSWDPPMPLGNITVGIVEQVGEGVPRPAVGDRVYGYLPIRETHTVPAASVRLAPPGVSDEMLGCLDPALVALTALREGNVRLGERVAVFGMGAIGLMAVQLLRLAGAARIIAVEPLPLRAQLAARFGAHEVVDPRSEGDVGLAIRRLTDMRGVDIALETSGNHAALHQAIRGTCYGGTIVPVAWYHGPATELYLGEEWHFNRQTLVSGARLESVPYRDHPRWDPNRVERTILDLFRAGQLATEGMLNPRVPISRAAEAYRLIDEHPEQTIKLAVEFPG